MRMLLRAAVAAAMLAAIALPAGGRTAPPSHHTDPATEIDPNSGAELLGEPAPAWTFTRWIGPPRSLASLRGKVVLIRWWTEGCHFCAATLPELEALRRARADQGLVVIGAFHPKPPHEVSDQHILSVAKRLGFAGTIAVDEQWTTLDRYWLAGHPDHDWTSVSFLIDRAGTIRWVHGGGEYHPSDDPKHARCDLQYRELEKVLAQVLAEPAPTP